ncbi:MAG: hypothetical protein ABIQ73_07340 [Acidimicrobiales bacterium]
MTTTVTAEFRPSHASRIRRNTVALFAAAAIVASTAFVVSEIRVDSPLSGAQRTNVSPLPGLGDIVAGSSFRNPVAATPLPGLGDIVAGRPAQPLPGLGDIIAGLPAHPLQGMGEMVAGLASVAQQ